MSPQLWESILVTQVSPFKNAHFLHLFSSSVSFSLYVSLSLPLSVSLCTSPCFSLSLSLLHFFTLIPSFAGLAHSDRAQGTRLTSVMECGRWAAGNKRKENNTCYRLKGNNSSFKKKMSASLYMLFSLPLHCTDSTKLQEEESLLRKHLFGSDLWWNRWSYCYALPAMYTRQYYAHSSGVFLTKAKLN